MEKLKLLILNNESHEEDIIKSVFKDMNIDTQIDTYKENLLYKNYDALIVCGLLNSENVKKNILEKTSKIIPVIGYQLQTEQKSRYYAKETYNFFSLINAISNDFMYACGNHIKNIFKVSVNISEDETIEYRNKNSEEYNNVYVFISQIYSIIQQYKKFINQEFNDLQGYLDEANDAIRKREYYRAYLIQKAGFEKSQMPLFQFKMGEALNLIGQIKKAQKNIETAINNEPDLLKHANSNFIFDKHKFKNKLVDKCPICGSVGVLYSCYWSTISASYTDWFDPLRIWMYCPECGHGFAHRVPADFYKRLADENTSMAWISPNYQICSQIYSPLLEKIGNYTSIKSMLDIGIGHGDMALTALDFGYDYDGIEISKDMALEVQLMTNHRIYNTDFQSFEIDKKYGVIIAGDVIEHVEDPLSFLEKMRYYMHDDGIIWISTPNMFSPYNIINKDTDVMPREVWHFQYFTKESLLYSIDKVGLKAVDYTMSRHYNGSMEMIAKKDNIP